MNELTDQDHPLPLEQGIWASCMDALQQCSASGRRRPAATESARCVGVPYNQVKASTKGFSSYNTTETHLDEALDPHGLAWASRTQHEEQNTGDRKGRPRRIADRTRRRAQAMALRIWSANNPEWTTRPAKGMPVTTDEPERRAAELPQT